VNHGKFEMYEYPDAVDFLARTVHETGEIGPIGFIIKPRIRVKALSRPSEPMREDLRK